MLLIEKLLVEYPLHKKMKLSGNYGGKLMSPFNLENHSFNYHCQNDKKDQTFKLKCEPVELWARYPKGAPSGSSTTQYLENRASWTFHFCGVCQYCGQHQAQFLLRCSYDWFGDMSHSLFESDEILENLELTKLGQFPAFNIQPERIIDQYLLPEDKAHYNKALICLSQNYSIGSYAYLRRIIENESLRIINDIAEVSDEKDNINLLITEYHTKHRMDSLINGIYKYLPNSLRSLDDNPLKLLYRELSGGIHKYSEEDCFEKSSNIRTLLLYIIKKLNEEKTEIGPVKEAIAQLKSRK